MVHLLASSMFCISIRSLVGRNFFSVWSLSSSPLVLNKRISSDSKQTLLHNSQCFSVTRFVSPINPGFSRLGSVFIRLDHTMATASKTSVHDFTVKVGFLVPSACFCEFLLVIDRVESSWNSHFECWEFGI